MMMDRGQGWEDKAKDKSFAAKWSDHLFWCNWSVRRRSNLFGRREESEEPLQAEVKFF